MLFYDDKSIYFKRFRRCRCYQSGASILIRSIEISSKDFSPQRIALTTPPSTRKADPLAADDIEEFLCPMAAQTEAKTKSAMFPLVKESHRKPRLQHHAGSEPLRADHDFLPS